MVAQDIMDLSGFTLDEIEPIRDNVIIRLPEETGKDYFRHQDTGLLISTTLSDDSKYYPVYGEVVCVSKRATLQKGDIAFFPYLTYYMALNRPTDKGQMNYDGSKTLFTHNRELYLIVSQKDLLFIKRGDDICQLNDWVILKHVPKKGIEQIEIEAHDGQKWKVNTANSNATVILLEQGEHYEEVLAEVVSAPQDMELSKGEVVAVVKSWDVNVENELIQTIGYPVYYLDKENVLKLGYDAQN